MSSERVRFALLLVCFFLSGFAALLYQTAWTREFSFVFGTSELAIAAVLSAYMAGLALGAAVAGRLAHRITRPVLAYGVLELLIAVGALLVPMGIGGVSAIYLSLLGGLDAPPETLGLTTALFHLGGTFLVLVPCTALMGATLPLLARHAVHRDEQIGERVGTLYAVNTAGAIAGTLCAAFLLLPELGLRRTVQLGAAANALVFLAAALLARAGAAPVVASVRARARPHWILPVMTLSGAVSFAYEVLWTRLLGQILGGSTHAFATMLASFLIGIALGSAVAARFARTRSAAATGFVLAQLGTGVFAWLAFLAADQLPALAASVGASARTPAPGVLVAGGFLLPFTLCIGATFPFAVRLFAERAEEAASASASVYAWNTVGSILGAIAAGFALLPWLGLEGTLALGVGVNFALAAAAALLSTRRRRVLAAVGLAGVAAVVWVPRAPPWELLRHSVLSGRPFPGEVVYLGVGRSANVVLTRDGGSYRVATNGLPESAIDGPEVPARGYSELHWLSMLPVMARPATQSMLIVGLGGGLTLGAVPESVRRIDVIELEPEVVNANRRVPARHGGEPLDAPRVTLKLGDARGALALADTRYDAIVSQPSHPWTSGASHLYTREFFQLVRRHLAPEGVFTQWIGVDFISEPLFRTLLATLLDVFPHVEVYRPVPPALLFVASNEPVGVLANVEAAIDGSPQRFAQEGIHRVEHVAAALSLDTDGARRLARGAPANTDDHNRLATSAFRGIQDRGWLDPLLAPVDPLAGRLEVLDPGTLMRRLAIVGQGERARRLASTLDGAAGATARGYALLGGRSDASRAAFERALALEGDREDARAGLLAATRGGAPSEGLAPRERALALGWQRIQDDAVESVRPLEPELALWGPGDLLYEEALRLRMRWRIASGEREHAAEALAMNDTLLVTSRLPVDLLHRARAARAAGRPEVAWGALEAISRLRPGPQFDPLRDQALATATRLPTFERDREILGRLRAKRRAR